MARPSVRRAVLAPGGFAAGAAVGGVVSAAVVALVAGAVVGAWRRRAYRDPLTGLANRAGLAAAWPALAARGPVVGLLDLDRFKPVNDIHGHAVGDVVLCAVAARLTACLTDAVVARLGGDEFAVVVPHPMPAARLLVTRAVASVAAPILLPTGAWVTVTASIGLAAGKSGLSEALADADAAMYRAKTTRAGVAVYDLCRDDRPGLWTDPRPAVRLRSTRSESSHLNLPVSAMLVP